MHPCIVAIMQAKVIRVLASHWGLNGNSYTQFVGIKNATKKKRETEVYIVNCEKETSGIEQSGCLKYIVLDDRWIRWGAMLPPITSYA
jgi:hypothetical protein